MYEFLSPNSIAIVGAGNRPTSSGGAVLANLKKSGYKGKIFPINPKGGYIQGLKAYTSLAELSEPAELVAILVRSSILLEVVEEAGETGHKNILILPGGFSEAGQEGRKRNEKLIEIVEKYDLRVGGPNCAGTINLMDTEFPFAATFFRNLPKGGGVALISQSGAIVEEAISESHRISIPLGAVVSVGNSLQLGVVDYLTYFGNNPKCTVIMLYLESLDDLKLSEEVVAKITKKKPVLILVGGRTDLGKIAAFKHTGSNSPVSLEIDKLCNKTRMIQIDCLRNLLLSAKVLGRFPSGLGNRILILSNSGGPGVLATDSAVEAGLDLVNLPSNLVTELGSFLPVEASISNPMDILADAREDRFSQVLLAILRDAPDIYDVILMIHVVPFMVDADPVVESLARISAENQMPMMHCMMGTLEKKEQWFTRLERSGIPVFENVEDMCHSTGFAVQYQ